MLSEPITQTQEAGIIANRYHGEIIKTKQEINKNFLYLGQLLYDVAKKKLYETMGYDSMEEYFSSPELNIKRTWAYDLMKVYRLFIKNYGVDEQELIPIGISRLAILARNNVVNKDNLEDWLHTARELSKADLIREVRGEADDYQPSEDNLRPGFYRITRMTQEPFGEFIELGRRNVIVGRDEGGIVLRVK